MNNYIGLNIKYLCAKKNITQKQLADVFESKQSTVASYVGGRTEPNIATLQKLSKYFNISIDDLININLEERSYINTAVASGHVTEPTTPEYGNSTDVIIKTQEKTISTLEKHLATLEKQNALLEKTIENLNSKQSRAS